LKVKKVVDERNLGEGSLGAGQWGSRLRVREGEEGAHIPVGCMLQATVGAVIDGLAKAVNHFSIYSHDDRSHWHGQLEKAGFESWA